MNTSETTKKQYPDNIELGIRFIILAVWVLWYIIKHGIIWKDNFALGPKIILLLALSCIWWPIYDGIVLLFRNRKSFEQVLTDAFRGAFLANDVSEQEEG